MSKFNIGYVVGGITCLVLLKLFQSDVDFFLEVLVILLLAVLNVSARMWDEDKE